MPGWLKVVCMVALAGAALWCAASAVVALAFVVGGAGRDSGGATFAAVVFGALTAGAIAGIVALARRPRGSQAPR